MTWSPSIVLKEKLSSSWIQCLEAMANSAVMPQSMKLLQGKLSNDDSEMESWESLLQILCEDEAVALNGELKFHPVFLSFPTMLQLRFLQFLRSNISIISDQSLQAFVQKINSSNKSTWLNEAICCLKNAMNFPVPETDRVTSFPKAKYAFTTDSQDKLKCVMEKMRNQATALLQRSAGFPTLKESLCKVTDSVLKPPTYPVISTLTSLAVAEKNRANEDLTILVSNNETAVDVIVIDDDSLDSPNNVDLSSLNSTDLKKSPPYSSQSSNHISDVDIYQKNKLKIKNVRIAQTYSSSKIKNACVMPQLKQESVDGKVSELKFQKTLSKKRKFSEIESFSEVSNPVDSNGQRRAPTAAVSAFEENMPESAVSAASKAKLSEETLVKLDCIRDMCFNTEDDICLDRNTISCFLNMDAEEVKSAVAYMGLPDFPEKALVALCDTLPWANLAHSICVTILDSCFTVKLTQLESQASQTLLMCLNTVVRAQPLAFIDVMVDVLKATMAGVFQCQVLSSISKTFLPGDCSNHLVSRLSLAGIPMTESLIDVLQAVVDKNNDLEVCSLTALHKLLTASPSELSSSAKFGKFLMGFLSKYRKKMSIQEISTVFALVEAHNSTFKKPLMSLLKRLR